MDDGKDAASPASYLRGRNTATVVHTEVDLTEFEPAQETDQLTINLEEDKAALMESIDVR